jgi:uncharacterized Zn finger protein (UPF0148 family)
MNYRAAWNLATIPLELLYRELDSRTAGIKRKTAGRPLTLKPCPKCGRNLGARQRKLACPLHEEREEAPCK